MDHGITNLLITGGITLLIAPTLISGHGGVFGWISAVVCARVAPEAVVMDINTANVHNLPADVAATMIFSLASIGVVAKAIVNRLDERR